MVLGARDLESEEYRRSTLSNVHSRIDEIKTEVYETVDAKMTQFVNTCSSAEDVQSKVAAIQNDLTDAVHQMKENEVRSTSNINLCEHSQFVFRATFKALSGARWRSTSTSRLK
jgi:hypothetical protein